MHGFNVLATDDLQPVLIDFADVRVAPAVADPLTMELSPIFHPGGPSNKPSDKQMRLWFDLDAYAAVSPWPTFIHACRSWTEDAASGPSEIAAVVLSYALRQLKYRNPTSGLAYVLAEAAAERLLP
jgi:hypothetical protein